MKEAGAQFIHASAAFGATVNKIAAVPRPPADDARLLKWFDQLRIVQTNLRKLGKALSRKTKSSPPTNRSGSNAPATPPTTSASSSNSSYCRLTPSRFT